MNAWKGTISRLLINEASIESDLHRLCRAGGHAHFASAALVPGKDNLHGRSPDEEGACRANRSAGSALKALLFVSSDILPDAFHLDSDAFQVTDTLLEILFVSAQLHHDHALFSRVDRGFEDIAVQIELTNEAGHNRLIDGRRRKSQRKHLGVHGNLSS